jgi:urease accessory protein
MEDGVEVGLILPRGTRLKDGDVLLAEDGRSVQVRASLEELSVVLCPDALTMARVAYHLGNRHASIMLGEGSVKYPADSVLDQMITGMGMVVRRVREPFQPESGAYDFTPVDAQISLLSNPPTILKANRLGGRGCAEPENLALSERASKPSHALTPGHPQPSANLEWAAKLGQAVSPERV